jgi:hypothetical protein
MGGDAAGTDLARLATPFGSLRFAWRGDALVQRSMIDPDLQWEVPQISEQVDPGSKHYRPAAARGMTLRKDGKTFGGCRRTTRSSRTGRA